MRIVLFGATGMIGSGALLECLEDPRVEAVLSVTRRPLGRTHPKLTELVHHDFHAFDGVRESFRGFDACIFSLGVSAAGRSEEDYRHITVDITLRAAEALVSVNPDVTFCYVSGQGTDSSEQGRQMWARVKGHLENRLLAMPMEAYMFRPGFILPVKGVRSSTPLYRMAYGVAGPLYPLLRRLFPRQVMTSEMLGRALLEVCRNGASRRILEPPDIIAIAQSRG